MKVLKFGGTSVGSPGRMHKLLDLLDTTSEQIIVLSAVSGTTNSLVNIARAWSKGKTEEARLLTEELKASYEVFCAQLLTDKDLLELAYNTIAEHFTLLLIIGTEAYKPQTEKIILAQGELLSTRLFTLYLREKKVAAVLLPALEFMKIDENEEPVISFIAEKLQALLKKYTGTKLFVTQGFICVNDFGDIDNLKRGGSDYTASLIGAALQAEEIQIWTDIDGMHNNDPRIVKNTRPIAELSFGEAAELAYFGAKILHPQSVFPAQRFNVPVRLLNTMDPTAQGTLISNKRSAGDVKSIAAKDGIIAINILSSRMLMAYGFLRRVFEVFERYKTPIDMITTSEVAVSLTIDHIVHLDDILVELRSFGTVELDLEQSIICVVGDFLSTKTGMVAKVLGCLPDTPIRMVSYGGSTNNMSILVRTVDKNSALQALHTGIFLS